MKRETTKVEIDPITIGTRYTVTIHDYYPSEEVKNMDRNSLEWYGLDHAYLETSVHAEELPGLLVFHHLIRLLDQAAERGAILKHITILPYSNPIGSNQLLLGTHMGRFSWFTGNNFNRNWLDIIDPVSQKLEGQLSKVDKKLNTSLIRKALFDEASSLQFNKPELSWKRDLYKMACISSIALDFHCDLDALLHTYTHERLWPVISDLSASIGSKCNLLSARSGGNMHEAAAEPFVSLQSRFPDYPIELACHSATVELRGGYQVNDVLARQDAVNLYNFLVRRGFIDDVSVLPLDNLASQIAFPLSAADMICSSHPGVMAWKVKVGDTVEKGQLLGEIVNIEDVDAARIPIIAGTKGIVFGMDDRKLAVPGDVIIYIAGSDELEWRSGRLMTD